MSMWICLFICVGLFAIGDVLGVATKAKVSSVFVALLLFLIGFLTGIFPKDIIDQAGLTQIAKWSSAILIVHMGTSINLGQLVREWRTVAMSVVAMLVAVVSVVVVIPLVGKEAAVVSIPIINGGIVATQLMNDAAMEKGMALAAALGAIIYAVQKFVGTVPASFFGLKEANAMLADFRQNPEAYRAKHTLAAKESGPKFWKTHEKYFTDYTCFAITVGFATLAQFLGRHTPINYSIWALLLGATIGHFGLVPPKLLDKGKASGLISMAVFAGIVPSLAKISVADLGTLGFQVVVIFAAVILGSLLFLYVLPLWKLCGSRNLAVGIAMAQLLGFPATFLIANEIATAVAETPEEKEIVLEKIQTAYVVAGFASVTSLSIVMAGIFVKFL